MELILRVPHFVGGGLGLTAVETLGDVSGRCLVRLLDVAATLRKDSRVAVGRTRLQVVARPVLLATLQRAHLGGRSPMTEEAIVLRLLGITKIYEFTSASSTERWAVLFV